MATDEQPPLSPLPKPTYGLLKPQPLNYQRVSQNDEAEINNQEQQAPTSLEVSQAIASISKLSPSTAMPEYQEHKRHQPTRKQQTTAEQGYSILGYDNQTDEPVRVSQVSRRQGLYILGLQGYGKSGLLENLIIQDITQHIGVCVLDPKGELIDNVIARLPDRTKEQKVILFDLRSKDYYAGLNLFACADPTDDSAIMDTLSHVLHVFEKAFGVSQPATPRIYDYLFNSAYTLISNPGYSLIDIPLLFTDACRQQLLARVSSAEVHKFWRDVKQLPKVEQAKEEREVLRRFNDLTHEPLRYIVGQSSATIDMREIMDSGKILLVKLDKRRDKATALIGSILVAQILNASDVRQTRKQFNLYADEFQRFSTEDFATLLEEARYAAIGITMAHQNRGQLELSGTQADANLKQRTLSVGNLVVFRVPTDAESLAGQFAEEPEAARIEVQKPQEHRRVEEQIKDGEEPVKVRKRQIIAHLLGQGHEDERVMQFVKTYLQPLTLAGRDKQIAWSGNYAEQAASQQVLMDLNSWLYDGVVNPANLFQPLPESVVKSIRLFYDTGKHYIDEFKQEYDLFLNFWYKKNTFWGACKKELIDEALVLTNHWQEEREKAIDKFRLEVQLYVPEEAEDFQALRRTDFSQFNSLSQLHSLYREASYKYTECEAWRKVDSKLNEIQWRLDHPRYYQPGLIEIIKDHTGITLDRLPNTPELAHAFTQKLFVGYFCQINKCICDGYVAFETFSESAELCQYALWQHPLWTTDSGFYQPRKRTQVSWLTDESDKITHPQPSEQEMTNRMARELINLPLYTARVKITTATGIKEHLIRTLEPEKGIRGVSLQERIARIQAQNRTQDERGTSYCRPRQEIEAEIRQRQAQYNQPQQEPPIKRHPQR